MSGAGLLALGDFEVDRIGYGAIRITGPGVWGTPSRPPDGPDGAIALLRRAAELGVNFFDTADSYGPNVSEELIAEALAPYDGIVVATKGGMTRGGPGVWDTDASPAHLRAAIDASLRRLRRAQIDVYQLHRPDPKVPFEESLGALVEAQREGKVRHIGLSNVTLEQLELALEIAEIVCVQNRYGPGELAAQQILEACVREQIAFIPSFPLASGESTVAPGPFEQVARRHGATSGQIALAWLLAVSPAMLPIPATSQIAHLERNIAAGEIRLNAEDLELLSPAAPAAPADR